MAFMKYPRAEASQKLCQYIASLVQMALGRYVFQVAANLNAYDLCYFQTK